MEILILGGTLFVGRAITERALDAGHDVTLFNRGRTNPRLFADVEHVVGDRDRDVSALAGRSFDAVIDTSAYFPRQVHAVVDVLGDGIDHYTFVSSCSVYADHSTLGADESAALATVDEPDRERLGADYGGFKALCERTLDESLPGRAHQVRAGLIVGPYDDTGRFGYWIQRIADGGEVLAPEPTDQPVQVIDVRDLADWILLTANARVTGAFNAAGAPGTHTMGSMLADIARVTSSDAHLTWVDDEFLIEQRIEPWSDLPLWLPPATMPSHAGFMTRDTSAARDRGLTTRPLTDTIEATRTWLACADRPGGKDYGNASTRAGLDAARERDLLTAWHDR